MLSQLDKPRPLPYQALRDFLAAKGADNVDAFAQLEKLTPAQKRTLYLLDDVHLTAEGHRLFAQAVLPDLERILGAAAAPR